MRFALVVADPRLSDEIGSVQTSRIRFYAKKPGNGRASYSILKDTISPAGRRSSELVHDERIDALNRAVKRGLKGAGEAEIEINAILADLKKRHAPPPPVFSEDNLKLFKAFWQKEYQHRKIIDKRSAKDDYRRALEALGTKSLISASQDDIQRAVDRKCSGNRQRRIVARLNSLLKFAGRDFTLWLAPKQRNKIRHLTTEEFKHLQTKVTDPAHRLFYTTLFATGCRKGEAFAMETADLKPDGSIFIASQMDQSGNLRERKNRRQGAVVIHPDFVDEVRAWCKLKNREEMRNLHVKVLRGYCKEAFPDDKPKWISHHDLRHSYAIYLLSQGVSMGLVAQSLSISVTVCQTHYVGFELSPQGLVEIRSLLSRTR